MSKLLPLLVICVACSPASDAQGNAAASPARTYATQVVAPSPDYGAMLNRRVVAGESGLRRKSTKPLPPNAKAVGDTWIARLKTRGALLGYGLGGKSPDGPVSIIDTGLTKREFDAWTKANRWPVPGHISWSFAPEMKLPRVSAAAKDGIRIWPASSARTGLQNMALFSGRVEMRNGCFYVSEFGRPASKLAWLHAEVGLDVDNSGYYIFRNRVSGETMARLGEDMNWGGPASADIDPATRRALHDACGPGELYVVGSPEATERFLTQYPHLRNPKPPPPPPP